MSDLNLAEYERICSLDFASDSNVTSEEMIENYLGLLTSIGEKPTVHNAFCNFKHLLYIHAFYNLENPALNISTLLPYTGTSEELLDLNNYRLSEIFIPIFKIILHCFQLKGFLTLTPPSDFSYTTNNYYDVGRYYTEYSYSKTSFTWNLPMNFMPVFSAIISSIYLCCKKKGEDSIETFFQNFSQMYNDAAWSAVFIGESSAPFIDHGEKCIFIHTSQKNFCNLLNNWADIYLAQPFLRNIEKFCSTYSCYKSANTRLARKHLLYTSVRALIATLISDTASPEIYSSLNTLLEKHLSLFPSSKELDQLYEHDVIHTTLPREIELVDEYIKSLTPWIKHLYSDICTLTSKFSKKSLNKESKVKVCSIMDKRLEYYEQQLISSAEKVIDDIRAVFADVPEISHLDPYSCDVHLQLISDSLQAFTSEISETLKKNFSKITNYFSRTKTNAILSDTLEQLNSFLKCDINNLTTNWTELKTGNSFPALSKHFEPGSLNQPPLDFYSKLRFSDNDLHKIITSLTFDFDNFEFCIKAARFEFYTSVPERYSFPPIMHQPVAFPPAVSGFSPALFALTLSKYCTINNKT